MKESLTDKNIALTAELNKLKEDHAEELAKLNKEAQEKINSLSADYTNLKIETDKMISNLDKALGIAKSQLESKDNSIKEKSLLIEQLEKDAAWLKPFATVNIQYQNRIYELEKILKENGIKFNTSDQK